MPEQVVDLLLLDIALPLGPYLGVTALLATIATVAFLAFVLTEDRYSSALSGALTEEPAERCLLLGVAFEHVTERSSGRPRRAKPRALAGAGNGRDAQ